MWIVNTKTQHLHVRKEPEETTTHPPTGIYILGILVYSAILLLK